MTVVVKESSIKTIKLFLMISIKFLNLSHRFNALIIRSLLLMKV